jgi:MFS family permease
LSALQGAQLSLVAPFLDSLGDPAALIGALVAVSTVVSLLIRVPAGMLYRAENARLLLGGAMGTLVLALAVHPLALTPLTFLLVRAVTGLGYGVATTVNFARFVDEQPAGPARARAMGYYTAGIAVGYSIASLVVGYVVQGLGYGAAFLTGAGLLAVGLLGLLDRTPLASGPGPASQVMRGATGTRAAPTDDSMASPGRIPSDVAATAGNGEGKTRSVTTPSTLLVLLHSPALLLLTLESFVLNAHWAFWNSWLPLYALAVGISLADVGLMRTVFGVFNAIGRPAGGGFVNRLGARRLATAGLAVQCGLLMLLPALPWVAPLMAVFALVGILRALGIVANTVGTVEASEALGLGRGRMSALFTTASDLGILAGPALGGVVAQVVGSVQVFVVWPMGMLLGYLGAMGVSQLVEYRRRPQAPGGEG